MQLSKNTSIGSRTRVLNILIKAVIFLFIITGIIILLSKIDFPTPNKEIEKTILNENLKIVK
jgi:hypothetical protein|tara:strand:- start:298 stop:483 length:186 start_codon:yes stop_codon:yes gene_type:complete